MAKSIEDQVLDKKTKEQIRQELLEVINTKVKDEIVEVVANDVRETFDEEKKNEIKNEISNELIIDIKDEINKEQKKLNRKKSFKIFRLHVYILMLIAIVCYLVYLLYINGGLDIINKYEDIIRDRYHTTTTVHVETDKATLINNYKYLVDGLYITNLELLKSDYLISNVDVTDKLAMVYNTLADTDITKEGIIYTITGDVMKNAYIKVFGSEDGYKGNNFSVNNISFAYQESTNLFIAVLTGVVYEPNKLYHDIIDVEQTKDSIIFTARVGLEKEDGIYNVFNLNESLGSKEEVKSDDLSLVEYTFKKIGDNYHIYKISKK